MTATLTTISIQVGKCRDLSNQLKEIVEMFILLRIIPIMLMAAAIRIIFRLALLKPTMKSMQDSNTNPSISTRYQAPHPPPKLF